MKTLGLISFLISTLTFASMVSAAPGKEQGSSHGQPFLSLQEQIDQTNADLDALAADNGAAIAALESDVADLQGDILALQDQIDANDGDIADLQDQLDALNAELATKQDILNGSGACPPNSSLRVIYPDGGYLCEYDTTVSYVSRTIRYGGWRWVSTPTYHAPFNSTATCPNGWYASGGGSDVYYNTYRRVIAINESRPTGNGWTVTATRTSPSVGNYVRAVAMCLRNYH